MLLLSLTIISFGLSKSSQVIDPNGYIVYCPCNGQFGLQSDELLQALSFSKEVNRTLVLPPWLEYRQYNTLHHAYNRWFNLNAVEKYHRVILLKDFLKDVVPSIWPSNNRTGHCYVFEENTTECNMRYGNAFGTFWQRYNIQFTHYQSVSFNLTSFLNGSSNDNTPPVFAFRQPPGVYVQNLNRSAVEHIHEFVRFSTYINNAADSLINTSGIPVKFLAMQLLSAEMLNNICQYNETSYYGEFFSATQCTRIYSRANYTANFTKELCNPSRQTIIKHVADEVTNSKVDHIFISTDDIYDKHVQQTISDLQKHSLFTQIRFTISPIATEYEKWIVNLAVMSRADVFIGYCVDPLTSFVRRHSKFGNKTVSFIGFEEWRQQLGLDNL